MEKAQLVSMVTAVQAGQADAAGALYDAFQSDIYYHIFKTVNDPELAADLTQDTFIEILQSIGSLQEPAAFVTWSRQLAFRRCTAYFKKRHDLLADEDEDGYSVFDTAEEERTEFIPDAAMDQADFRQTVMAMINELPEEQRSFACIGCRSCEAFCPQGIKISEALAELSRRTEEFFRPKT